MRQAEVTMPVVKGYAALQIALHWIVALLILGQFVFGEAMGQAWRVLERGGVPEMTTMVRAHILGGILIMLLAFWRLVLRSERGVPPPPEDEPPLMQKVARATHIALYLVMVLVPTTGILAWFGRLPPAAELHEWAKPVIIGLVLLHGGAALWHHFVKKDGVLRRMLRPQG